MREWQKPSIWSLGVILGVLALVGWLAHTGKLTITEAMVGALVGVVTWITNGARPAALDKLPGGPKRDDDDEPPTAGGIVSSVLVLALASSLVVHAVAACASKQDRAKEAEDAYRRELVGCVHDASTEAEADTCAAGVRARWDAGRK